MIRFDINNPDIMRSLYDGNWYIHNNINEFLYMHNTFINMLDKKQETIINDSAEMSDDEIFNTSEKIIDLLGGIYKEIYEVLRKENNIIIDHNNTYKGSRTIIDNWDDIKTYKIVVEDKKSYNNVIELIHEFMHITNAINGVSFNRDLFGEFISIFIEFYSGDFLKQINKRDVDTYNFLSIPFENNVDYFDSSLDNTIYIKRVIGYFKHLLGWFMAYYLYDNIDIKKILYLNEHIKEFNNPEEIFKYLNINNLKELVDEVEKKYNLYKNYSK